MRNQAAAVSRRLTDPDFQGALVHRCILLTLGMGAALCVSLFYDAWIWTHPVPPRYFFTDGKHAPRPVVGLDSPIVDDTQLLDWTVQAALAPYNIDYYNYPVQLNTASRRFTLRGWNTFANSFIGRGNFDELKRARLLCHAQSQRAAVIHQTSFVQGALAYQIQVPITQTCENANQTSSNNLMITALVIRTNDDDHPDGRRSISSSRRHTDMEHIGMRRVRGITSAARLGLVVSALCAAGAALPAFAQAPPAAPGAASAQSGANDNPAAQKAVQDAIPLTPEMIEALARRFRANQQTQEQAVTEMAVPDNRQINTSFAPGGATSIIQTIKGYPTAVSFFDSTGQPWPVQWDTNSNPAAIAGGNNCNVQTNGNAGGPAAMAVGFFVCAPTKGSNVLEITPVSLAPRGGLVVSLEGAPKPLTFLLVTGGGKYDANLSVHVADRGPHAKVEILTRPDAPDTGAPFLTGMLQGVPPADATPLDVEGVSPDGIRAWRLGRNVYLRTRYTLLSPEWTASEAEGGTTVYAVPSTPVVLLSVNGRTVSALLKDPS